MAISRDSANDGLPSQWELRPDGYYYQVPLGSENDWNESREFFLGRSLPAAFRVWATRLRTPILVTTVGDLLDRYSREVVPNKAITTQEGNAFGIVRLKSHLGTLPLLDVTPQLVQQYFDQRQHKVAAHREIEILSHAYTKAVDWGYSVRHPFKRQLRLPVGERRRRFLEDWEVTELLSLEPKRRSGSVRAVEAYARLMLLTGLRRTDLLRLQIASLKEHGIEVEAGHLRESFVFPWTEELRAAVSLATDSRPAEKSLWLFCKADGTGYFNEGSGRADGWDSMWGRFVDRVLAETNIGTRFTEYDLRARSAFGLPACQHPGRVAARAHGRSTTATRRIALLHLDASCTWMDAVRLVPIDPKLVTEVPVAEFTPAGNGLPIHQKKRKLQIKLATPACADREQIKALYEKARTLTRESGSRHVVDHIVPLHHPLVCGLHVAANMRVVPERLNAEKHNRFVVSEEDVVRAGPVSGHGR